MGYLDIGRVLGWIAAPITFLGAYVYCISEYGFLWGFGFGWLPSAILAFLVYVAVMLFWGLAAVSIAVLIFLAIRH
jgi:hypothetical protein